MGKDDSIYQIDTEQKLQMLLKTIRHGKELTGKFHFETEELHSMFLSEMIPQGVDFEGKYYYFDKERNLHIAESDEGFLWISTMGLVPIEKYSDNMYVNAFVTQKEVMLALLESAERLLSTEAVYDIDSFENGQIRIFSPAIWSNFVFLIELTCKAYLRLAVKQLIKHIESVTLLKKSKRHCTVNIRTIPYFMHILFWRWKRCQNILKRFRGRLMKHISNMMQMNRTTHASLFQKRQ